jgi:parallel beta-helix repeat protein
MKMRKGILALLMSLYLLSILSLGNCEKSVKASQTTWIVDDDGPADFNTIQEAINGASDGDTIYVYNGTYYENILVNKTVSLVGQDRGITIIDGQGNGNVVSITAGNVSVHGFTISNSGIHPYHSGIFIDGPCATGSNISHNNILNNNDGVSLYYASNNLISNNIMSFNHYNGIVLYSSGNNLISNNIISYNYYYGVFLYSSGVNMIVSNTISSNYYGIYLYSSDRNLVSGNNVSASQLVGMYISYSVNNTVYHNNFSNMKNVQSDRMNDWDYGGEGNYWNGYTGQDLNQDGIGDAPYVMSQYNQDNHPLMGMFYYFSISLEKETYSVTIISNLTIYAFRFEIGAETGNKIVRFNATGEDNMVGFYRVKIPTELMNYSYIVLIDSEEITSTLLNVSNETYAYLYFSYLNKNQAITIIYSETLRLYNELLARYLNLQMDFNNLNNIYYALLENFNILLSNYTQLQISFDELNNSYQMLHSLNKTYYDLLDNYLNLQMDFNNLNNDHSQLLINFDELNNFYQEHLTDYSEHMQNIRSLTYIFVAATTIFIITTLYLSKRVHTSVTTKTKAIKENR